MIIESPAFKNGDRIASKYTCDGADISPELKWRDAPKNTKSFALISDDPDAPMGVFTHWIIFNIPPSEGTLKEGIETKPTLPNGSIQGKTDFGRIGYGGPCPPSGTHRYRFHIYALDTMLSLSAGSTKQQVLRAIQGHVLEEAETFGLYSRR
ncbi:MAG: YbhB/YbcL family Raf kinase inhibitor-like protein [Thaumarchaeota archaeon]|nr:YbhB/YbcL family Raf kinase inhibitor-like protein [Nitrososphaerota archaeon]